MLSRLLQLTGTGLLAALLAFSIQLVIDLEGSGAEALIDFPTEQADIASSDVPIGPPVRRAENTEAHFAIIVSRPLFTPGRRPNVPEAKTAKQVAPRPATSAPPADPIPFQLTLSGVLEGTEGAQALILGGSNDASWRRVGDTVQGWTIITITNNEVVLSRNAREHRLELYK